MGNVYLYGIVAKVAAENVDTGVVGLDGTSPVGIVPLGGIGCVISAHWGEAFGALPREELVRRLLAHQQVVEHVMQGRTVLPVKFGTILEGPDEVRALLAQVHADLVKALDLMRDKVEVEVAATWDVRSILNEIGQEKEIVRAREAIAARGCPTLEDKVRLGQVVNACLDRRRDAYRERMLDVLQPLAVSVAPNALVAEEMVMNVAFLVQRARQGEFDEGVRELDSIFDNRVNFRVIGPLPPYSFSTVQVTRLSGEQVEQARRELDLPDLFTEAEVRRAYRRLAARGQRKAQGDVKAPADQPASLRRASEVLLARCRAPTFRHEGDATSGNGPADCLFAIAVGGTGHQEINAARFGGAVRV